MVNKYDKELFDVTTALREFNKSSIMLRSYLEECNNMHRPLLKKERKLLTNTLIDSIVKQRILLKPNDFMDIVQKIQDIFKREVGTIYYRRPQKDSKPGGKLHSSYRYRVQKARVEERELAGVSSYYT